MYRKPNLFIIGAMKSGTTSLCQHLGDHSAIFMSSVREPMHFSREENYSQGHERYLQLFANATDEIYLGEGSTEYTKRPFREGVAQRLHEFSPSARLIYIMRDPFDRLVSQYRHQVQHGRESRTLLEAIKRPSDYLSNSYYAYQLRPYLELFGREAVYIDTFESLVTSPGHFCNRLFGWLGIDTNFVPYSIDQRFNLSPSTIKLLDDRCLRVKVWRYFRQHSSFRRLLPLGVRQWYRTLMPNKLVLDVKSSEFQRQADNARKVLQPLIAEWVHELMEITGRSYEEWPTVAKSVDPVEPTDTESISWLPEEVSRIWPSGLPHK